MLVRKSIVVAGLLVLLGAPAGCGGGSSSSSAAGGATDAATSPRDASQAAFCQTFTELGGDVTPHAAADRLTEVGTPSGITDSARHGFEILVSHLGALPDASRRGDFESLARHLRGSDQSDVIEFVTYYATECSAIPSM